MNMNKKLIGILVCILFFGASVCPSIAGYEKVIVKKEIYDYNNPIKYALESGLLSNNSWLEQDKLLASDGAEYDRFSWCVSIDGDYALIGSPYEDNKRGAAYVFKRDGNTWTEEQKLLASDGAASDLFGRSVSIDGDYALIGAPIDDSWNGSVYVFKRDGNTWTEVQKLRASESVEGYDFGWSVSIDGDYALIGALYADTWKGAAHVFIKGNQPPNAPTIDGPSRCTQGVEYKYSFVTTDPEDDFVSYYIDFGGETYFEWNNNIPSGWSFSLNHTWYSKGFFVIRAKARDVLGAESDWSTLTVHVPRTRSSSYHWLFDRFPMLEQLLRLIGYS